MDIQLIGSSRYAVMLSGGELREHQISQDFPDVGKLRSLLEPELGAGARMLLELYPGRDECLLFVTVCHNAPVWYGFDSFEDLISAVQSCCTALPPSSLFYYNNSYILELWPADGFPVSPVLLEFGHELDYNNHYEAFLSEHGKQLLEGDAVERLRRHFPA